MVGLSDNLCRI